MLRAPAGRLLAPMLPVLVPLLCRDKKLEITDAQAELLVRMSAATIDRKLSGERAKLFPRGRSHTKPGTLLKSQIPVRTWAEWDDAVPGFVEIDLVGHEGGNSFGEFCFALTVTDISTGWTVNRSVRNKAVKLVFEALEHVIAVFPFPVIGIDSDNGSEFINDHLLAYCQEHQITFTRSRPGNKNDGAHVEQKNWAWSGNWSATSALTPPRSWRNSTKSGSWTGSSPTICCPSKNSYRGSGTARK
ncbi:MULTISPECIES: integrase catalytic domain-containing protein [Pseudarthrobacter]|uniref:integrase catalytic domain-containing protein n=1 Tax=Pseudarthrobacter TaxID=1742993 RepID=UPI0013DD1BEE|nr:MULTISPECIES: DDE-type integrase/transposase/recombinase [Pseudarthrobacter]MDP9999780.1 hypothetical protein [Pseudarthrobacter sulfonivorans]